MLNPQERALVKALIDQGEPLPERFRDRLFAGPEAPRLVWAGKGDGAEPAAAALRSLERYRGPHKDGHGWRNRLILGDNGPVLAALQRPPLAEAIRQAGGLKLIYIDPPFAVGADFPVTLEIGGGVRHDGNGHTNGAGHPTARVRYPAYRDSWAGHGEAYLSLMYERLRAMHALLAEDGCLFLHCDWRSNAALRLILDEVFGKSAFVNEIVWHYYNKYSAGRRCLPRTHDTIFFYAKNPGGARLNPLRLPRERPMRQLVRENVGGVLKNARGPDGKLLYRTVEDRKLADVWEIPQLQPASAHWSGFPTQKHHELMARILGLCTREGDLVADFFSGSGTFAVMAQAMGRRWIACDAAPVAVHVARKRLLGVDQEAVPGAPFELMALEDAPPDGASRLEASLRRVRGGGVIVTLKGFAPAPLPPPAPNGNGHGRPDGADPLEVAEGCLLRRNGSAHGAERLTRHWSDWIDYWAVDGNAAADGPAGNAPFRADWWAFRSRRARALPLASPVLQPPREAREVAVMAVDPFGRRTLLRLPLHRRG